MSDDRKTRVVAHAVPFPSMTTIELRNHSSTYTPSLLFGPLCLWIGVDGGYPSLTVEAGLSFTRLTVWLRLLCKFVPYLPYIFNLTRYIDVVMSVPPIQHISAMHARFCIDELRTMSWVRS